MAALFSRLTIRFEIDGRWSTEDMGIFCLALDDLYMLHIAIRAWIFRNSARGRFHETGDLRGIARWMRSANPHSRWLEIVRIEYGSPGIQDIAGIGEIVGHIKDFVLRIIEHASSRRERELKNTQLELENTRLFLQLAEDHNMDPKDLTNLIEQVNLRQAEIQRLVEESKIRSVRTLL